MIAGDKYIGPEVDTWSLGVVLYAMVYGKLPFESDQTPALYRKTITGDYTLKEGGASPVFEDLIAIMIERDPKTRATLDQIKIHPWVMHRFSTITYLPAHFVCQSGYSF
jgi:serine/threonine protein kinase